MQADRTYTVAELADRTGAELVGSSQQTVRRAVPLSEATAGDISFIDHPERIALALRSEASVFVVPPGVSVAGKTLLVSSDVATTFSAIVLAFRPARTTGLKGIHPTAVVSPTAKLGSNVAVGPHVVIGDETTIEDNCTIHGGVIVGNHCHVGTGSTILPRVTLYDDVRLGRSVVIHAGAVIGSHGFGYRQENGRHEPTAQLGGVVVGDLVEIGANCTIDRGTYGDTRIGEGTKIDNLVQVAHNCQIGEHNLLCSQVGIAGSTTTGDYVTMAGQVGVRDHVKIGSHSIIGAMAGVSNDVDEHAMLLGAPAIPIRDFKVQMASLAKLPQLRKQVKELTKSIERLVASSAGPPNKNEQQPPIDHAA